MTDFTLNLVDAIISGRATDIENAFQEAITDRISIAMEYKRTNIAQSMFTKESVELEESTNAKSWAAHNARTATRKKASAEDLHAEFKKHANNPGHPWFKGKFSDDKDGGKTAEQKAITNIAIGTGKADKTNYLSKISHLVTPKSTNEEFTLEDYSVEELEDFMMSEDFEQLDELSRKTLSSYIGKARSSRNNAVKDLYKSPEGSAERDKNRKTANNRTDGKERATDTLRGKTNKDRAKKGLPTRYYTEEFTLEDYSLEELEDFMMSEDFEQLDELSKATLGSYVKKASAQQGLHSYRSGMAATSTSAERKEQGWDMEHDEKKSYKRKLGIIGAANKLSK